VIVFRTIKWKNILSTGNSFTEIKLDKSPNTLIIGNNGAGKSTILDALCFVLFGKPFRKINKPNLVNSINTSDAVVEIEFTIGKKKYKIVRGIKPNTFEIYLNGVLLNQDAKAKDYQDFLEKSILKFNYKSFTQIVILGSASFVPFMQLTPADRRTIIEELLDIQIFTSMNGLIKERMAAIKDSSTKNKYAMELASEKIKMQKQNIDEHKKNNEEEIESKKQEIQSNQEQVEKLNKDIVLIQKHIDLLNKKIEDKASVESKSKKLVQLEAKLESSIKKTEKDIAFYHNNDNCPTCKQTIDTSFKEEQVNQHVAKALLQKNGLQELNAEYGKLQNRLNEIMKVAKHVTEHNNEIVKHNSTITAINQYVTKLNKEIKLLSDKKENLTEENHKLKELKTELAALVKEQESLSVDKHYHEYAASLLKDNGIKTKIIKQYLPIINKLVNKYLKAMDFFVNFNLNENFEETIKSRHRDEFSYSNFSEGEKMRIDLALLFTWRQIAKMKNSTNTNLLILDEVFDSSLDGVGTDEFLKLIHDMGSETNIFVISHKGDQLFDKFRSIIKFKKVNNFSQVEK
jgi:DNA repair exonuclease SbcCD ATPase subunit